MTRGLEVGGDPPQHLILIATVHLQRGEQPEAHSQLERVQTALAAAPPRPNLANAGGALAFGWAGYLEGDEAYLDVGARIADGVLASPVVTPAVAAVAALGKGLVAVARDDADLAAEALIALGLVARARGLGGVGGAAVAGAMLATAGRPDDALSELDAALDRYRGSARAEYAWVAYQSARILVAQGDRDARPRAERLTDETITLARELGMTPLLELALELKLRLEHAFDSPVDTR